MSSSKRASQDVWLIQPVSPNLQLVVLVGGLFPSKVWGVLPPTHVDHPNRLVIALSSHLRIKEVEAELRDGPRAKFIAGYRREKWDDEYPFDDPTFRPLPLDDGAVQRAIAVAPTGVAGFERQAAEAFAREHADDYFFRHATDLPPWPPRGRRLVRPRRDAVPATLPCEAYPWVDRYNQLVERLVEDEPARAARLVSLGPPLTRLEARKALARAVARCAEEACAGMPPADLRPLALLCAAAAARVDDGMPWAALSHELRARLRGCLTDEEVAATRGTIADFAHALVKLAAAGWPALRVPLTAPLDALDAGPAEPVARTLIDVAALVAHGQLIDPPAPPAPPPPAPPARTPITEVPFESELDRMRQRIRPGTRDLLNNSQHWTVGRVNGTREAMELLMSRATHAVEAVPLASLSEEHPAIAALSTLIRHPSAVFRPVVFGSELRARVEDLLARRQDPWSPDALQAHWVALMRMFPEEAVDPKIDLAIEPFKHRAVQAAWSGLLALQVLRAWGFVA